MGAIAAIASQKFKSLRNPKKQAAPSEPPTSTEEKQPEESASLAKTASNLAKKKKPNEPVKGPLSSAVAQTAKKRLLNTSGTSKRLLGR